MNNELCYILINIFNSDTCCGHKIKLLIDTWPKCVSTAKLQLLQNMSGNKVLCSQQLCQQM